MSMLYYLEDLVEGARFTTGTVTLSEQEIIAFATAFDPQPFHIDPIAAKDSAFGGLVASGWHTAALTMRLLVESEFKPAGGLIGAGGESISWPRPVWPGDTLQVTADVLSARPSRTRPTQGIVVVRVETVNQRGETVQLFQPRMIVARRLNTE